MQGVIKTLIKDKGFGFIKAQGTDYFFHRSCCLYPFDSMQIGEKYTFDVENSPKGPRAVDLRTIDGQ